MSCVPQCLIDCFFNSLEQMELYEPSLTIDAARKRLVSEKIMWQGSQKTKEQKNRLWESFQFNSQDGAFPPLVEKGMERLKKNNTRKGVAVDLGCGTGTTVFNLLEAGWTVYAVDSSNLVIQALEKKVSDLGKNWIKEKKLVLVNCSIEDFEYPKGEIHFITATESLPYCDPEKLDTILLAAKNALSQNGVFVANLFPYKNKVVDSMLRNMFGAWMTKKNVVDAMMKYADFSSYSVTEESSPGGKGKQFHILAEAQVFVEKIEMS